MRYLASKPKIAALAFCFTAPVCGQADGSSVDSIASGVAACRDAFSEGATDISTLESDGWSQRKLTPEETAESVRAIMAKNDVNEEIIVTFTQCIVDGRVNSESEVSKLAKNIDKIMGVSRRTEKTRFIWETSEVRAYMKYSKSGPTRHVLIGIREH